MEIKIIITEEGFNLKVSEPIDTHELVGYLEIAKNLVINSSGKTESDDEV